MARPKFHFPMEPTDENSPTNTIHFVSSSDSSEFAHLSWALSRSPVIGLDAEWKPIRTHQPTFPTVSLIQIACQLARQDDSTHHRRLNGDSVVFLLDLLAIPLPSIYELLRDVFASPHVLKLGFRFKQDLVYLSSTFCSQGCDPGFDRLEPFLDITSIYCYLQHKSGRKQSKDTRSLATICKDVLAISLSKELQCSDWSIRPLTEEQKIYAAADAKCLLDIFDAFQVKVLQEENSSHDVNRLHTSNLELGLKQILHNSNSLNIILRTKFCEALAMVHAASTDSPQDIPAAEGVISRKSCTNTIPMNSSLLHIIRNYGDKISLNESDKMPKTSKKKGKRQSSTSLTSRERQSGNIDEWQGPPPWDVSLGGDGYPKFLCDVMVEGLAKHLRCVGIDAATPYSRKPESRVLIDQAIKGERVLLTRDAKLLRHDYLINNQIYRVKSLLKNEQLLEVIETFHLKICEDQLMSRCTKCNGRFIQKPLTTEEAIEAAKGFQLIPKCLFDKNLEFWQCMDCNQLYWEGTQYHNAVQKFIDVCKLNE